MPPVAGQTDVIFVTEKNIKEGKSGDCYKCPVALAFSDRYPDSEILVVSELAFPLKSGLTCELPPEVGRFIEAVDGHLWAEATLIRPFHFTVAWVEADY